MSHSSNESFGFFGGYWLCRVRRACQARTDFDSTCMLVGTTTTAGGGGDNNGEHDYSRFMIQQLETYRSSILMGLAIGTTFYCLGCCGAIRYSSGLVFLTGIWYCILMTMNL